MKINIIAAVDGALGIGKDNDLVCPIREDLKRFKSITKGFPIIMGRKTFESLPGVLPLRKHIVITRQADYQAPEGVLVASSLKNAIKLAEAENVTDCFVIGGGEIYKKAINIADKMYLTEIQQVFEATTFFPSFRSKDWAIEKSEPQEIDGNGIRYTFTDYIRK